ncbi:hypothetical protein FHL15_010882 [Xylaria flabelliformis]|uniref:HD domain-containing protein n=1 Tax=Xylaria flabelliformis TaxID=2512241 RepID=A0A553HJU0_9PEZI|nr:hypothetical protein FHL15_010882 [Xylaria flabelliformis]
MRFSSVTFVLALAASTTAAPNKSCAHGNHTFPLTTIAGIKAVDTPLVQKARALVEANFEPYLVRHMYRSWLFGAAAINNNATLASEIDLEVHALGTLLHDLGWDQRPDSPWRSTDRRFEIDGAIGATNWIKENGPKAEWDAVRLQLVWDAISLHGTPSISEYKQPDVKFIVESISMDYPGPHPALTEEDYNSIIAAYPQDGLLEGTNDTFTFLCRTKPDSTYDTWIEPWGVAFVEGYNPVGHRLFDRANPNVTSPPAKRHFHKLH